MEDTKTPKIHLTLTNNETGDVMYDGDVDACIVGFCGSEGAGNLAVAKCDGETYANALAATEEALEDVYAEHPELKPLAQFYRLCDRIEDEETENEE